MAQREADADSVYRIDPANPERPHDEHGDGPAAVRAEAGAEAEAQIRAAAGGGGEHTALLLRVREEVTKEEEREARDVEAGFGEGPDGAVQPPGTPMRDGGGRQGATQGTGAKGEALGRLEVTLLEARELKDMDLLSKNDACALAPLPAPPSLPRLPCPALPCPALPSPPALPCPALLSLHATAALTLALGVQNTHTR